MCRLIECSACVFCIGDQHFDYVPKLSHYFRCNIEDTILEICQCNRDSNQQLTAINRLVEIVINMVKSCHCEKMSQSCLLKVFLKVHEALMEEGMLRNRFKFIILFNRLDPDLGDLVRAQLSPFSIERGQTSAVRLELLFFSSVCIWISPVHYSLEGNRFKRYPWLWSGMTGLMWRYRRITISWRHPVLIVRSMNKVHKVFISYGTCWWHFRYTAAIFQWTEKSLLLSSTTGSWCNEVYRWNVLKFGSDILRRKRWKDGGSRLLHLLILDCRK